MSADLLRQAAEKLDTLAEAATPTDEWWDEDGLLSAFEYVPGFEDIPLTTHESDAAYIAAMHPSVAKALASALGVIAEAVEDDYRIPSLVLDELESVARAVLSGDA